MKDLIKIIEELGLAETNKKLKKAECLEKIDKCQKEHYYDFYIKKTTKEYSMVEFGIILKDKLKKAFKDVSFDLILIENQIGPLALRMKTLQGMIMQHFIENGNINIKEISASNKLKKYLGNKKTTYAERKKESIKITIKLIKEYEKIKKYDEFFNKHKKKDDLADCFLQGLWYIDKLNEVNKVNKVNKTKSIKNKDNKVNKKIKTIKIKSIK